MPFQMGQVQALEGQAEPAPPQVSGRPVINFTLSTDTLLFAGAFLWLLWDKLMRPTVARRLEGAFAPIEEEKRLTAILAQIGVLTGSSRVVLAAFHNGQIDRYGFHLQRLTAVNQYTAPGYEPMRHPIRDLPIGRVMTEVEMLTADPGWVETRDCEELPEACLDHLRKNNICRMVNRMVKVGNLPIGIVSLQYCGQERRCPDVSKPTYEALLEDLFEQICLIMRRRVIHPSRFRRILAQLGLGPTQTHRPAQEP